MITLDARTIMRTEEFLQRFPKEAPKYIADAVNRAASATKTAMIKRITETHNVTPAAVKKTLTVTHANSTSLAATVKLRGLVIRLAQFSLAQDINSREVLAAVLHGESPKPLGPMVFFGRMIRGQKKRKTGVFSYQKNKVAVFKRLGSERLPIKQLFGPAIASMLHADAEGIKQIEARAQQVMIERLHRGFDQLERKFK